MTEFESDQARTTQCPDCSGVVSLRATTCPHCGAPLTQLQRHAKPRLTSTSSAHNSKALIAALVAVVSVVVVVTLAVVADEMGVVTVALWQPASSNSASMTAIIIISAFLNMILLLTGYHFRCDFACLGALAAPPPLEPGRGALPNTLFYRAGSFRNCEGEVSEV